MIGSLLTRIETAWRQIPRAVLVDTLVWLSIPLYHWLSGSPEYNSAYRFFLEILVLALFRETVQRALVKRAATRVDFFWGFLFSFLVFTILGVGVWLAGIACAWVIVSVYAVLMLAVKEPDQADSEPVADPGWSQAQHKAGLKDIPLLKAGHPSGLIFTVGSKSAVVVVDKDFFSLDPATRTFLYLHELGHIALGHYRRLAFYNVGLYAIVIVLSISAAALSGTQYLLPSYWLPLGHCWPCGMLMTWLGWWAQRSESSVRLTLETEADRFAVVRSCDQQAALSFLEECARHPAERTVGITSGGRASARLRLQRLRYHLNPET
jgi:hypothetical protein